MASWRNREFFPFLPIAPHLITRSRLPSAHLSLRWAREQELSALTNPLHSLPLLCLRRLCQDEVRSRALLRSSLLDGNWWRVAQRRGPQAGLEDLSQGHTRL